MIVALSHATSPSDPLSRRCRGTRAAGAGRPGVAFALVWLALSSASACATASSSSKVDGSFVYVAPFVDETPGMEVGFLLTQTVQETLYARAPRRFLVVFDDAACAVDGTVIAVDDVAGEGEGKRDVVVSARAVVVDKAGRVRHDTGVSRRAARYAVSTDPEETARRRERARVIATSTVGRALVDDILRMP